MDFKILISKLWPLGEVFRGFGPHSPGRNSEVNWLELMGFPIFCPVAFQWPDEQSIVGLGTHQFVALSVKPGKEKRKTKKTAMPEWPCPPRMP